MKIDQHGYFGTCRHRAKGRDSFSHVDANVYTRVYTRTHTHVYTHMNVYAHAHTHVCPHVNPHVYPHVHPHVSTHRTRMSMPVRMGMPGRVHAHLTCCYTRLATRSLYRLYVVIAGSFSITRVYTPGLMVEPLLVTAE